MIDREKYLERQRRYNRSEKGRERWRSYYDRRMKDPLFHLHEIQRKTLSHARNQLHRSIERAEAATG